MGLVVLYFTLQDVGPLADLVAVHPLGVHGGIWALLLNSVTALGISAVTAPPTDETRARIHGEIESVVYGSN